MKETIIGFLAVVSVILGISLYSACAKNTKLDKCIKTQSERIESLEKNADIYCDILETLNNSTQWYMSAEYKNESEQYAKIRREQDTNNTLQYARLYSNSISGAGSIRDTRLHLEGD